MDRVDFAEARGKCMYINEYPLSFYQENCRIYFDEYSEVKEYIHIISPITHKCQCGTCEEIIEEEQ